MAELPEELRDRAAANLQAMRTDDTSDWPMRLIEGLANFPDVTEAELMTLRCASRGLRDHETAVVLGKSLATVKSQLAAARRKLLAKTTCQAACEAVRRGLIP